MKLYNIKENDEQVSFGQAVRQGLGRNQGLFFRHNCRSLTILMLYWLKISSLVAARFYRR